MKFRKPLKITSRTSSVTNGFVQAIIPSVEPTPAERAEALSVLGMSDDTKACVYCGNVATDWDHLRALVKFKKPTGFGNEIKNLVPACWPCNQSKSGQEWRVWMNGNAKGSPRAKGVKNIANRIATLEAYEAWGGVNQIDLEKIVEPELWQDYWHRLEVIETLMFEAQRKLRLSDQKCWNRTNSTGRYAGAIIDNSFSAYRLRILIRYMVGLPNLGAEHHRPR